MHFRPEARSTKTSAAAHVLVLTGNASAGPDAPGVVALLTDGIPPGDCAPAEPGMEVPIPIIVGSPADKSFEDLKENTAHDRRCAPVRESAKKGTKSKLTYTASEKNTLTGLGSGLSVRLTAVVPDVPNSPYDKLPNDTEAPVPTGETEG